MFNLHIKHKSTIIDVLHKLFQHNLHIAILMQFLFITFVMACDGKSASV